MKLLCGMFEGVVEFALCMRVYVCVCDCVGLLSCLRKHACASVSSCGCGWSCLVRVVGAGSFRL